MINPIKQLTNYFKTRKQNKYILKHQDKESPLIEVTEMLGGLGLYEFESMENIPEELHPYKSKSNTLLIPKSKLNINKKTLECTLK